MGFDEDPVGHGRRFFGSDLEGNPIAFYQKLDESVQGALRSTMRVAYDVVSKGGFIVFVGLGAKGRHPATVAAVESCQAFLGRWKPGVLKNWGTYVARKEDVVRLLADGSSERKAPAVRRLKQEQHQLDKMFVGAGPSAERPDLVFAFDFNGDLNAIEEAKDLGIPVAAIVKDSRQAAGVTYALPDDDHLQTFYAHMVARAAREGMTRHVGLFNFTNAARGQIPSMRHPSIHELLAEDLLVKATIGSTDLFVDASGSPALVPTPATIDDLGTDPLPFDEDDGTAFVPSDKLVGMVHRGLTGHAIRLGAIFDNAAEVDRILRKRARAIAGPRILEAIAWRARRMIAHLAPARPLIANGEFDDDFLVVLSESLPFRRDLPFFPQLKEELTDFLARGGSIAGTWGHLKLEGNAVEFVLAAPNAKPETNWEKPSRIEFN